MAIIYTYPTKATPLGADLVLISDSADGKKSKNATIASLVTSNAIDVVDTVTASGSGITASPNKGNVVITNTGVTSLIAGSSIGISGSTGAVTLTNTGVTSLTAGTNISLSGSTGSITISTSASNVDGSGTAGKIPKWSDSNTLTDSVISESGGKIGIGTTAPLTILDVSANGTGAGAATGDQPVVRITQEKDSTSWQDEGMGRFEFFSSDGSSNSPYNLGYVGIQNDNIGQTAPSGALTFATTAYNASGGLDAATERMRITSTGNIGVGNTAPVEKLDVTGNIKTSGFLSLSKASNSVKISTPATITTSYELVMPAAVGTASQVLKLPSPIGATPYQLAWGDASGGGGLVTSLATVGTSGASTLNSGVLNIPNYANTQNTLTITGTGAATLVGTILNIPTPNIPVVNFISLTTAGTSGNSTLTSGVLNIPNYSLVLATNGAIGGVQIGYAANAKNYPVELASEKMYVNVPWTDTQNPVITASQGLTKTSNNITLDIAAPSNGWAILGGGVGVTTPVVFGSAGANATGTKNFGITTFTNFNGVTSADNNVAMGFASMGGNVSTASNNVVLGTAAGSGMTTALDNVVIGQDAGTGLTAGGENTIVGHDSGNTITTGDKNTLIGSGIVASTGAASIAAVAVGRGNVVTEQSTAIGSGASVTGATGTALGNATSVTAANGIAIGQGCAITGSVLGLASASNPIQTITELTEANIDKYLTVIVNGETRWIALYNGTP